MKKRKRLRNNGSNWSTLQLGQPFAVALTRCPWKRRKKTTRSEDDGENLNLKNPWNPSRPTSFQVERGQLMIRKTDRRSKENHRPFRVGYSIAYERTKGTKKRWKPPSGCTHSSGGPRTNIKATIFLGRIHQKEARNDRLSLVGGPLRRRRSGRMSLHQQSRRASHNDVVQVEVIGRFWAWPAARKSFQSHELFHYSMAATLAEKGRRNCAKWKLALRRIRRYVGRRRRLFVWSRDAISRPTRAAPNRATGFVSKSEQKSRGEMQMRPGDDAQHGPFPKETRQRRYFRLERHRVMQAETEHGERRKGKGRERRTERANTVTWWWAWRRTRRPCRSRRGSRRWRWERPKCSKSASP